MIELIYNEEEEYTTGEKVLPEPKNVKQVGEPREYKKIFIEDYVHTFLQQYASEKEGEIKAAILLGDSQRSGGKKHLYVKSALATEGVTEKKGRYQFTEIIWGTIYQDCKKYFPEQEILGWFLSRPGFAVEKTAVMEETHRTYFSGADKLLFVLEPVEKDSGFFGFDGNRFVKQSGYYIYYEKNEPMQAYMIEKNRMQKKEPSSEKPDVAMASFRKIQQEKKERNVKRKKRAVSYGAKVAVAMVLFVGALAVRNQMEEFSFEEQPTKEAVAIQNEEPVAKEGVVVEELPGNVTEQEIAIQAENLPVTEEEIDFIEELPEEKLEEAVEESPTYVQYIVQQGDTLAKISRDHYGTDEKVAEICSLNEITDGDYIQAGEIILLP